MSQPPFNPFEAQLDRDAALSILREMYRHTDCLSFKLDAKRLGSLRMAWRWYKIFDKKLIASCYGDSESP